MSIVRRVRDMGRASWHEMLEQSDDPIRLLDRYLHEQRNNLREMDLLYQTTTRHSEGLRRQAAEAERMAERRQSQAELALKAGEENLARLALEEKMAAEDKAAQYNRLYVQGQDTLDEMQEQLQELHAEIRELSEKRQYFQARLESLQLQKRIDARRSNLRGDGFSWMNRLETAISDLETESEVYREFRGTPRSTRSGQSADVIEAALEKLKQQLGGER